MEFKRTRHRDETWAVIVDGKKYGHVITRKDGFWCIHGDVDPRSNVITGPHETMESAGNSIVQARQEMLERVVCI